MNSQNEPRTIVYAVAIALMLIPAILGATLDWRWWIEYALLSPPLIWLLATRRLALYEGIGQRRGIDRTQGRPSLLLALPLAFAATAYPTRFSGIAICVAIGLVVIFWKLPSRKTPSKMAI